MLLLLAIAAPFGRAFAEEESAIKAYFIYQFTNFISWPETLPMSPLVIAVLGETPVSAPLKVVAKSKSTPEQEIKVIQVDSLEEAMGAHILFVPKGRSSELGQILKAFNKKPVLVITEAKGLGAAGAAINFIKIEDRIGFEVNLETIQRSDLYINSRILRIAEHVY